jgi:hypothetical protein
MLMTYTVYVADRSNNRIEVLDNSLNWSRDIKYDPPFSANYFPPIPDFGKSARGESLHGMCVVRREHCGFDR